MLFGIAVGGFAMAKGAERGDAITMVSGGAIVFICTFLFWGIE